jgi:hypothetical protein
MKLERIKTCTRHATWDRRQASSELHDPPPEKVFSEQTIAQGSRAEQNFALPHLQYHQRGLDMLLWI